MSISFTPAEHVRTYTYGEYRIFAHDIDRVECIVDSNRDFGTFAGNSYVMSYILHDMDLLELEEQPVRSSHIFWRHFVDHRRWIFKFLRNICSCRKAI